MSAATAVSRLSTLLNVVNIKTAEDVNKMVRETMACWEEDEPITSNHAYYARRKAQDTDEIIGSLATALDNLCYEVSKFTQPETHPGPQYDRRWFEQELKDAARALSMAQDYLSITAGEY